MEYRFEEISPNVRVAIPVHYNEQDIHEWKNFLGKSLDETFASIWVTLTDEEKIRINQGG